MSSLVPMGDGLGAFGVVAKDRAGYDNSWNPSSLLAAGSNVTVESQPPDRLVDPSRQSAKSAFPF